MYRHDTTNAANMINQFNSLMTRVRSTVDENNKKMRGAHWPREIDYFRSINGLNNG